MRLPGLILLLIGFAWAAAAAETPWQEYRSLEGGFAVLFPGTPNITEQSSKGASLHSFVVDRDATAFLVIYTAYPPGTFAGRNAQAILDRVRDGLVEGQKTTIRADRPLMLADHPGRELVIDDANGSTQIYRLYVAKDRLYQVICGGPRGYDTAAEAKRFQDSFQWTER